MGITQWRKEVRLWIKLRRKMLELILNSSWLPFWCLSGAFRRRSWAFSSSSIHPGCKKRWWFWFEKSCKLGMGTGCLWHTPGAATSHHLFCSCSTNGESVLLNYNLWMCLNMCKATWKQGSGGLVRCRCSQLFFLLAFSIMTLVVCVCMCVCVRLVFSYCAVRYCT